MNVVSIVRCAKFAAVILAGLMIAGCAKQQVDQTSSSATPGSQQDFVVNVGDRVFFETDSSELTELARATLDKQAPWLNNGAYMVFRRWNKKYLSSARLSRSRQRRSEWTQSCSPQGWLDVGEAALRWT